MSYFSSLVQNVVVSTKNSSTSNIEEMAIHYRNGALMMLYDNMAARGTMLYRSGDIFNRFEGSMV